MAARISFFPHHENEIAQSEAITGARPFSRYWVHNGLLQLGEDKMSKSLGNLVSVEDALSRYSAESLRLYFLSSHYRSPLQYTEEGCAAMERSVERLRHAMRPAQDTQQNAERLDPAPFQQRFLEAMDDDLNTPRALASLFDLAREINRARDAGHEMGPAQSCLSHLGGILGLAFDDSGDGGAPQLAAKPFIEMLLATREKLREAKQYALADQIRDDLVQQGVTLEDSPQGVQWHYRGHG